MTPDQKAALLHGLEHAERAYVATMGSAETWMFRGHMKAVIDGARSALAEVDRLRKAVAAHEAWQARGLFTVRELASIDRFDAAVRDARDGALEEVAAEARRLSSAWPDDDGRPWFRGARYAADLFGDIARSLKSSPADRLVDEVRRWGT